MTFLTEALVFIHELGEIQSPHTLVKLCVTDLESKMSALCSTFSQESGSARLSVFKKFAESNNFEAVVVKVPAILDAILPILKVLPTPIISTIKSMIGPCARRQFLDIRAHWVSSKLTKRTGIQTGDYGKDIMMPCDGSFLSDKVSRLNEFLEPLHDTLLNSFLNFNDHAPKAEMNAPIARMFYIDPSTKKLNIVFAAPFYFSDNGSSYMAALYSRLEILEKDLDQYMHTFQDNRCFEIVCCAQFWDDREYDDPLLLLSERFDY